MKYKIKFTSRFKKDLKLAKKQGKDIDKLFSIIEKIANGQKLSEINADKLTFEDESTIVDILEKMNLGALDEALISKLKSYHSDRINDILDKELKNDINVRLIPQSMKSITIEEAERENILLLQAKIEYSKGTADYENNLAIMKEYLTQYPESSQLVKDFRNIYGELTGQGVTELKSYVNNLLNETIKYNINATNVYIIKVFKYPIAIDTPKLPTKLAK